MLVFLLPALISQRKRSGDNKKIRQAVEKKKENK